MSETQTVEVPAPAPAETKDPAKSTALTPITFDPDDPVSLYMDSAVFEQLQRVAGMMCRSDLVPDQFRGKDKLANCAMVVAQAFRWRMDPFAVIQHVFVRAGRLGYEGKLIAALVNCSSTLQSRLRYTYSGPKNSMARGVVVSGRIKGETEDRTVEGSAEQWHTTDKAGNVNEPWQDDVDQMLAYRGARQWARRHLPETMLGILSDDEVEAAPVRVHVAEGTYVPSLPVEETPEPDPVFEMAKDAPAEVVVEDVRKDEGRPSKLFP